MLLKVSMEFKMSFGKPFGPASNTTILESPGAIAMDISMSNATSLLPLLAPVVGLPLKLSSKTVWRMMFVRPPPAARA